MSRAPNGPPAPEVTDCAGGRGGIRTHGEFNPTFDFESSALNRAQPPFQMRSNHAATAPEIKPPMAEFVDTTAISYRIERLLKDAQQRVVLISPYVKLRPRIRELIEDALRRRVTVRIVYGEKEECGGGDLLRAVPSRRSRSAVCDSAIIARLSVHAARLAAKCGDRETAIRDSRIAPAKRRCRPAP